MNTEILITKERKESLEQELHELKTEKRPAILERLQHAKSLGDLSENAEYHDARDAQGKNEDRIKEIEAILRQAVVVEKSTTDEAGVTSVVTVKKEGENETRDFTLVSKQEADMSAGKISIDSPIGQSLFGKKKGDVAEVETPGGVTRWNIIDVK